jgi:hypothetical protein
MLCPVAIVAGMIAGEFQRATDKPKDYAHSPECNGKSVVFATDPPKYGVIGCTCGQCAK